MLKILFNVGINFNIVDQMGKIVLYFFFDYVNLVKVVVKRYFKIVYEIICLLYNYGVDLNVVDFKGRIVVY